MTRERGPLSRGSAAWAGPARSAHASNADSMSAPERLSRSQAQGSNCSSVVSIASPRLGIRSRACSRSVKPISAGSLAEQRATALDLAPPQRDIARLIEHDLLSLAAQDEAQELVERRIERLAGSFVGIEESKAA